MNVKDIPLPDAWPDLVRKAMLHVASLARWDMIYVHAISDHDDLRSVRSASRLDRRDREIALLQEELRIKDIRMTRIPARNRPYYPPTERMAILILRSARGWNLRQTAKAFGIAEETMSRWMKVLDDDKRSLVQLPAPVNKYPEFVEHVCQRLTRIFHTLPAASTNSTTRIGRNADPPLCSVFTQRHRRITVSTNPDGTLRALATKECEICGLRARRVDRR